MKHIVKRLGHLEPYDVKKLYASVFAACLAVREPAPSAELIADSVSKSVHDWLENKHEVTSKDIFAQASKHLDGLHPDAGFIYKHHRNIS